MSKFAVGTVHSPSSIRARQQEAVRHHAVRHMANWKAIAFTVIFAGAVVLAVIGIRRAAFAAACDTAIVTTHQCSN